MSSVDKRVVQMQFDNADFQDGVKETQKTLDDFDKQLNDLGKGASSGGLGDALSGVGDALDSVKDKFDFFGEFATGIVRKLGEEVLDLGENLVKSLSLDQITAGWTKYESVVKYTASIQNQAAYQGYEDYIGATDEALAELQWYADSTSYSMDAMLSALNSFMGAGVDLNQAVQILEGLGNSFSYMGATATEMDGAFAMISKSMGDGATMGQAVAKSLQQVYHVLGEETIDIYTKTAHEMGILEQDAEGQYYLLKETQNGVEQLYITASSFKDSLSEGWLSGEVLQEVYGTTYGNYANNVYKIVDAWNNLESAEPATKAALEEWAKANDISASSVLTTSQAMEAYEYICEKTGEAVDEYGKKVFNSAMEAKSFSEVIDAIKDATSTQFSSIFESIFGKYNDAKVLFTELNDYMSSVFVTLPAKWAEVFKQWSAQTEGGRDTLIQAFKNIAHAAESIIRPVIQAFKEVFGEFNVERLTNFVVGFEKFTAALSISEETAEALKSTIKLVAKVIKFAGQVVGGVISVVANFVQAIRPLFQMLGTGITYIAQFIDGIVDAAENLGIVSNIVTFLNSKISGLKSTIASWYKSFTLGTQIVDSVGEAFGGTTSLAEGLLQALGYLGREFSTFSDGLSEKITGKFEEMKPKIEAASTAMQLFASNTKLAIENAYTGAGGGLKGVISGILELISNLLGGAFVGIAHIIDKDFDPAESAFCQHFVNMANAVKDFVKNFTLDGAVEKAKDFANKIGDVFKKIISLFTGEKDNGASSALGLSSDATKSASSGLQYYRDQLNKTIQTGGTLYTVLYNLMILIRGFATSKLIVSISKFSDSLTGITNIVKNSAIGKLTNELSSMQKKVKWTSILAIATGVLMLAIALGKLAAIPADELGMGLIAVGSLVGLMSLLMKQFGQMDVLGKSTDKIKAMSTVMLKLGAAVLILAVAMKIIAGTVDEDGSYKGCWNAILAIAALVVLIGGAAVLITKWMKNTEIAAIGTFFVKVASAMLIMANALKTIADIDSGLKKAVITVAIMVALMTGMVVLILLAQESFGAGNFAGLAAAIVGFGVFLYAVSGALAILGAMSQESLQQGITAMTLITGIMALFIVVAGMVGGGKVLATAAGILVFSIALYSLIGALLILGSVDQATIGKGLLWMAGILGVFAVAVVIIGEAATVAAPGLLALAAVILAIGVSVALVSAAVLMFAAGLQILSTLQDIGAVISGVALGIVAAKGDITAAIVAIIGSICAALVESFDIILDTIITLVQLLWEAIKKLVATFFPKLVALAKEIWEKFLQGLKDNLHLIIDGMHQFCTKIINKVKDFFGIASPSTVFADIGKNLILGLVNGIKNNITKAVNQVKELGNKVLTKIKGVLGINSPSTAFAEIGEYCDLGLAEGLTNYSDVSEDAASGVGDSILSSLADSLDTSSVTSGLSESLTITPVLDMSEIQNEASSISDLTSSDAISGSVSSVSQMQVDTTSSSIDALTEQIEALRDEISYWKSQDSSLVSNLPDKLATALEDWGVYLDSTKVGSMVTKYQANASKRTTYYAPR